MYWSCAVQTPWQYGTTGPFSVPVGRMLGLGQYQELFAILGHVHQSLCLPPPVPKLVPLYPRSVPSWYHSTRDHYQAPRSITHPTSVPGTA
eukprot:3101146-Rhodomonas_salina.1